MWFVLSLNLVATLKVKKPNNNSRKKMTEKIKNNCFVVLLIKTALLFLTI
jgi:hypothetical protein